MIDFDGNREEWISALLAAYQVQGREQWFKVRGRSMRPLLREGDEIQVRFCLPENLRKGDLAVFQEGKILNAHRILDIRKTPSDLFFLEKGDSNPHGGYIPSSRIKGVVQAVRKPGGVIGLNRPFWRWWNRMMAKAGYGFILALAFFRPQTKGKTDSPCSFGPLRGYRSWIGLFLFFPLLGEKIRTLFNRTPPSAP
jgi:signal peptidase I